jgi:hypothetical protein
MGLWNKPAGNPAFIAVFSSFGIAYWKNKFIARLPHELSQKRYRSHDETGTAPIRKHSNASRTCLQIRNEELTTKYCR